MEASVTDPILTFSIMVIVTLMVPFLAGKSRIPDMVLLLVAGAVLGPHGMGILERNSAILLFGSVGMVYLMFLAGLEIDLHRFMRSRRRSLIFGLLTFALPQFLGTLLGRYVLAMDWSASILLASMFASHTLLAYPVASRLGIVQTEPVAITIGATIITDILALMVLAVIADVAKGIELTPGFWVSILASLMALIGIGLWGIPWLSRWFFRHNGENGSAQFLFVIGVVCAFAYGSHYARMEPIIGAFLAGIAFNRLIPPQSTLMNRVEFVGNTVFIPFFLISVGMLINPGAVITDPDSWMVAGIMVAAVIVTKYMAAHIVRIFFGYSQHEGHVMFGLSVVQAAATLAAVLVGYELGIFNESVLNGAIAMILVTCPLGSWVVDSYGREMLAQTVETTPAKQVEQRILLAVINTANAARLLDLAFVLRDMSIPSLIHPITVIPDEDETTKALANAEKLLAHCLAHASSVEVPISPGIRIGINIGDGIARAAKEMRADIAMFGWSTDKTVASRIFGSVRTKMLAECPARLLFCRLVLPLNTTRRLLLPLPPQSEKRSDIRNLMEESKQLAKQIGADLRVYLCNPASAPALRSFIEKIQPLMPVEYIELPDWRMVREQLLSDGQKDDMAILPLERRIGAFWTPSLDRLPNIMAERFPEMNLLAAYPALLDTLQPALYETNTGRELSEIIPVPWTEHLDWEKGIAQIVKDSGIWNSIQINPIQELLRESAKAYPVEIAPGAVLLHAHTETLNTTTLLVSFRSQECLFPNLERPVKLILILMSPKNQPPDRHLAVLATLARTFHSKVFLDKLAGVSSSLAVADLLQDAMTKE